MPASGPSEYTHRVWVTASLLLSSVFLMAALATVPVSCPAEPFLVSDPYSKSDDQPTEFRVTRGSETLRVPAERLDDGSVRLKLDLSRLPDGEQSLEIRAVRLPKGDESDPISIRIMKNGKEVTVVTPKRQEPVREKRGPSRIIPGMLRP